MAEIQAFRGVLYRVPEGDLVKVLAPPYDVIPPAYQAELLARDPRNVVRIVLSPEPGDAAYTSAAATFERLQAEGVLAADPEPALYLLEQGFEVDGRSLRRLGLLTRFKAEDPEKRTILPHEHTRKGPKEDRYRLLKATRANFSPIFLMFDDKAGRFAALAAAIVKAPPFVTYTDDGGVVHRLWRVVEPPRIRELSECLAASLSYIADGHHRYATALRYRDETGPDGAWSLGCFTPLADPGLLVLPYHRILSSGPSLAEIGGVLAGRFRLTPAPGPREAAAMAAASKAPHAFAFAEPGQGARGASAPRPPNRAQPGRSRHLLPAPRRAVATLQSRGRGRELRALSRRGGGSGRDSGLSPGRAAASDARRADRRGVTRGRVDAREEHVLPPEAAVGPRDPPAAAGLEPSTSSCRRAR
jgi:hypothetical protein